MDIRQQLEQKERELLELRSKLAQVDELEQQKRDIENSINTEKQQVSQAKEQLDIVREYCIDKLSVRRTLEQRKAELNKEKQDFINRIDKQLQDIKTEIDDITLTTGNRLEQHYFNWWRLANRPKNTEPVLQSTKQGYNIHATEQARLQNGKMYRAWDKYYMDVLKEVGLA